MNNKSRIVVLDGDKVVKTFKAVIIDNGKSAKLKFKGETVLFKPHGKKQVVTCCIDYVKKHWKLFDPMKQHVTIMGGWK